MFVECGFAIDGSYNQNQGPYTGFKANTIGILPNNWTDRLNAIMASGDEQMKKNAIAIIFEEQFNKYMGNQSSGFVSIKSVIDSDVENLKKLYDSISYMLNLVGNYAKVAQLAIQSVTDYDAYKRDFAASSNDFFYGSWLKNYGNINSFLDGLKLTPDENKALLKDDYSIQSIVEIFRNKDFGFRTEAERQLFAILYKFHFQL